MTTEWKTVLEKYLKLDTFHQVTWLSNLLYIISMMARSTYEAGTEKVIQPELLRRYNELLHRISTQQFFIARGVLNRMPDDVFFEMIYEEIEYLGITSSVINLLNR
ncbi:hypothetical protein [Candidatus Methylomicrobium oryzae]|uniref:hypothetical protein n=1 Tax=Candidatus Methylomicrobium oryzae TaxID=2802053 RepID=UPI001922BB00|nr:hypothetical protein [Methylomicrobium sp. RS1]MBL1265289.1 hypothetical protein [Methylomicrobium sp. RS1]